MKYLFYRLLSYLPSRNGQHALNELKQTLNSQGINFEIKRVTDESGVYFMAESTNLKDKHIVTTGKSLAELDQNIKDAIFTIFKVPAYYCDESLINSPLLQNNIQLKYATG